MYTSHNIESAAILVVYSDEYAKSALKTYIELVKKVSSSCQVIVVTNNQDLRMEIPDDVVFLHGTNILHEFGAWQTGLDYLKSQTYFSRLKAVFFANDTFCHHRAMGWLEKLAFTLAFRKTKRRRFAVASGETSSFSKTFEFDGIRLTSWICTYLFAINRAALDGIAWRIHDRMSEIQKWVPGGSNEAYFFSPDIDPTLRDHLLGWLFGRDGKPRWRKAEKLSIANAGKMQAKALMIVCEKMLTTSFVRNDVHIESVYRQRTIRILRRIVNRCTKWRKLL